MAIRESAVRFEPQFQLMKFSRLIRLTIVFTILGFTAVTAQAIEILQASYGVKGAAIDVRRRVQDLVNRGEFSFPVSNQFFGADPAPRRGKGLYVVYVANGRQHTQTVNENQTFVFQHRDGGYGGRPPFPPPPNYGGGPGGPVRFVSNAASPARVFLINPYGGWQFISNLPAGGRFSTPARPGQRFVVTDAYNRVLREVTARPGGETVVIP